MPYDSPMPTDAEPMQAVVVYCSDGRFGDHVRDFLEHRLNIERFDAIAVAGGPVRLTEPATEGEILEDLTFLIEHHGMDRVVLIQHEDCGHYRHRLGLAGDDATARQIADLFVARDVLRESTRVRQVDLYMLRMKADTIRFEPVRDASG